MTDRNRRLDPHAPPGAETFDLDDFDGGGAPLELEPAQDSLYEDEPQYGDERGVEREPGVERELVDAEPWPTGVSPEPGQYEIDPATAEVLAGYGRVPRVLLDTPLYAFTVFQRRLALKRRMRELQVEFIHTERERDDRLARLADEHRAKLGKMDAFRRVLAPLASIQQLTVERHHELETGQAQFQADLAAFDQETGKASEQRKEAASKLAAEVETCEARDRDHQRAVARLKRIHIERRAIAEAARQNAPPGTPLDKILLTPEQSARVSRLEADGTAAEAEVQAKKRDLESATLVRNAAETALDAQDTALARIARNKQKAQQNWEAQITTQQKGLGAAEQQRRDALVQVARQILAAHAVPLDGATLAALRAFDAKIDRLGMEIELHALGLDVYDRHRFRQGIQFPLAALGGLILLILIFALL